jgi:hypothetical protein
MNLDFLEEICANGKIVDRKVLAKNKVVVLPNLFHYLLHSLLKLDRGAINL